MVKIVANVLRVCSSSALRAYRRGNMFRNLPREAGLRRVLSGFSIPLMRVEMLSPVCRYTMMDCNSGNENFCASFFMNLYFQRDASLCAGHMG